MKAPHRYDDNPCKPRHFKPPPCAPVALDEAAQQTLDIGRTRLLVTAGLFVVAFAVIALRLVDVTLVKPAGEARIAHTTAGKAAVSRADIVDRNGVLLATTLSSPSLFANPKQILDAREATQKLVEVLPDLSQSEVYAKLTSDRSFVWLKRLLTPRQEFEVNQLGIPGFQFQREERRVYPEGNLIAHVVGYTGLDNKGLAGIERGFDDILKERKQPLQLSIDIRLQEILHDELSRAVQDFSAKGGVGLVMDVHTGEVLALVSLPDFDPNKPGTATPDTIFNRATLGTYEMGSTFKIFTTAMALDSHTATLASSYDASHPIHIGRFTIHDYHDLHRALSVPEIFEYSSNIGAARMAMDAGTDRLKDFLGRLGLLKPPVFEIPEIGAPLVPSPWHDVNTMTVAFGHGISVSPLQLAIAASAVVNGGILHPATIIKPPPGFIPAGQQVMSTRTSDDMRRLMRLVVEQGTGEFAAAPGYVVGGKTGTAEKVSGHSYAHKALLSSFLGAFPINDPRYLVLAIVDEPHGTPKTHGFATGGWTAAPVVGHAIQRMAPLLGIPPVDENAPEIRSALAIDGVQVKKLASN
ncbi:MAG TPA: penicillin-binding protein 2 [Stellaceae bacterium]|nr:penicillin-binding protein 2 [Stellaceae bacterium]